MPRDLGQKTEVEVEIGKYRSKVYMGLMVVVNFLADSSRSRFKREGGKCCFLSLKSDEWKCREV